MSTHTPGPWTVIRDAGDDVHVMAPFPRFPDESFAVASNIDSARTGDELLANAALIAAAPDLLAALRAAEDWITVASRPPASLTLAIIRAAIAKAEGKQ